MNLHVYYGFTKLKPSITKPELVAVFENERHNGAKNDLYISRLMITVHSRFQTEGEAIDASVSSRMFTKYSQFIDERPWKGDFEKLLQISRFILLLPMRSKG